VPAILLAADRWLCGVNINDAIWQRGSDIPVTAPNNFVSEYKGIFSNKKENEGKHSLEN
jgi:hypothetical protein